MRLPHFEITRCAHRRPSHSTPGLWTDPGKQPRLCTDSASGLHPPMPRFPGAGLRMAAGLGVGGSVHRRVAVAFCAFALERRDTELGSGLPSLECDCNVKVWRLPFLRDQSQGLTKCHIRYNLNPSWPPRRLNGPWKTAGCGALRSATP